jgi:hypothetical protein
MLRNQQNLRARSKQSADLQRRYGYLEKAFDGDTSRCLASANSIANKMCDADKLMQGR